jgi:hypothetical protein
MEGMTEWREKERTEGGIEGEGRKSWMDGLEKWREEDGRRGGREGG